LPNFTTKIFVNYKSDIIINLVNPQVNLDILSIRKLREEEAAKIHIEMLKAKLLEQRLLVRQTFKNGGFTKRSLASILSQCVTGYGAF
jgi:hypothetical protein